MTYITVTDTYLDNLGIWRYENVSWPVYALKDEVTYSVKDIDGAFFECSVLNCIITRSPSRLINIDMADYMVLQHGREISDYNALYKQLGVDQELNTRGQFTNGEFDREKKKEIINETNICESPRDALLKRNLLITD